MKWLLALLFVVAFSLTAPAQETRIAAVVNDEIITVGDLTARLMLVLRSSNIPDTPEARQRLSSQVLRNLVDERLQLQEAKRLGVKVTDKDVAESVERIEQRNNMPKGGLEKYMGQQGIPMSALTDQLSAVIAFGKVVRNRISQDVSVSDDEVSDAMSRLKDDIGKPQSRVSEIFLSVDNPSQEDEVHKLADRLVDQIRGGANFSSVAQQFSKSPSAAVGGDIGWVTPSQLSPLLGEAVAKMRPGEMSYPIRTPAGFYLLNLVDRKTLGASSPDQITMGLVEVIFAVPPGTSDADHQRIEAQAKQVATTAKSCGEMSKFAREQAPQLSRQITRLKASDLPPEIQKQVLALKVAEPSPPLTFGGNIGVVMVCDRQDPPGLPTRDEVADTLARERLDTLARRYLRDLRRGAYVDIRG